MNEKWFSREISDIEKKLKTNAASGLSPKAARSRYRKNGGSSFYLKPKRSVLSMLGEIMADFTLILLIISSIMAICFTEYTTGITLTVIIVLNLAACLFLCFRTQRLFESLSAFFRPSVTVIRSGKAFTIDPEHVVEGDVVIITEGDILCFDARLVTSDNLKLSVRVDRDTEEECEKLAEGCVRENENDIRKMTNMVHAGSRVVSGSARAIVTAVGRYTYYGAMTGGVKLPEVRGVPHGLKLLRKYCSSLGMILTLLILPFSVLSLLFSHGNVTLMTTFTAALSIAASSMSQLACTVCRVFFERQAKSCLSGQNPCVLRSSDVMDRLVSVEYLFMLDGSAVSDGVLHFSKAVCAEGEMSVFNAVNPAVKTLAELAALYNSAESKTLTTGIHAPGRFSGALREFSEKTGVDSEALKIRCNISGYVTGNSKDKTDKLFYTDRGKKYILSVSQDVSALASCKSAYYGSSTLVMSEDKRASLAASYEKYKKEGKKVLVFTLSENEFSGESTFAGMLVLSEYVDSAFTGAVEGLKALGVRTVSFVNLDAGADEYEVSAPVIGHTASLSDFIANKVPVTYMLGRVGTYQNFSPKHIDKLIAHIHSMNKKVAVICFSDTYKKLSEKPDVFISCSELQYRFSGRFEEEIEAIELPGSAESLSCRRDVKAEADVIIPRPSENRGGLLSLKRAFMLSGAAYNNLTCFFRYVLCSQFIRIVTVLLPMISGSVFLDARHALFCGFIIDILAMLTFVFEKCGVETAVGFRNLSGEFRAPVRNNAGIIIASGAGGLSAVILPNLVGALGFAGQYFYQTETLFISVILLQITVMYCIRIENFKRFGALELNKFAAALDIFAVLFITACFIIEPLGVLFDVFEITFPYLVMTLIPCALCALLYFLIGKLRIRTE